MSFLKAYLKPIGKDTKPHKGSATTATTSSDATTATFTPKSSRSSSLYPVGDFRNSDLNNVIDIKTDVMANWLHQQQLEKMWSNGGLEEGVLLKKSREDYVCCPRDLKQIHNGLYDSVMQLNVRVCYHPVAQRASG